MAQTVGNNDLVAQMAIVPVLKVLSMGAIGAILAHPRIDVINPASTKLLSKLVFALFLPCLIFTELGAQVSFENMMYWWFIPVNAILSTIIGCAVGYLVALICQPPRRFYRFTMAMTGIGNTGNLPLAIIGSICRSEGTPFGSDCQQAGVAYVSFSTWIAVIIVYTIAYHLLEPPEYEDAMALILEGEPSGEGLEQESEIREEVGALYPSVLEADWPGLLAAYNNDEHRVPFLKKIWMQASQDSQMSSLASEVDDEMRRVACLKEPGMVRKMRDVAERTPLQHIFQPPMIASFLAIAVGLSSWTKRVIFGDGAPLAFVDDSLTILAEAMVPCIMLVLGGTLSGGPGKSELGRRTTIGVCVTRLFVLPIIGFGVVRLADRLGFLPNENPMFGFVLFLHYTMPTAILCGAMASLRGYGEKEASSLLFWQHLLAVLSISLSIAIYVNFLTYT